jgi:hypothetical protein
LAKDHQDKRRAVSTSMMLKPGLLFREDFLQHLHTHS